MPISKEDLDIQINLKKLRDRNAFEVRADIKILTEDSEKQIGTLEQTFYVPFALNQNHIDIADELTQDLTDAAMVYEKIANDEDEVSEDWLHLGFLRIDEEYRGHQLGYYVVAEVCQALGSRALVTANPRENHPKLIRYWKEFGLHREEKAFGNTYLYWDGVYMPKGFLAKAFG